MGLAAAGAALAAPAPGPANAILLEVDLSVDPAREKELVSNFRRIFRPAISKQPGFVSVRLMKLRQAVAGSAPAGLTHRLLIAFQTEEQRLKWVATDEHQKVWPSIEKTTKGNVNALLFEPV